MSNYIHISMDPYRPVSPFYPVEFRENVLTRFNVETVSAPSRNIII